MNLPNDKIRLLITFSTILVGFPMYTKAGIYYLELYDNFICSTPVLFSILLEMIIFGYMIN